MARREQDLPSLSPVVHSVLCLLLIILISGVQPFNPSATNPPPEGARGFPSRTHRIVGGIETKRNEYPFIVSLFRGPQFMGHFCGGSIIGRSWIITAAHCVSKADFSLTAGEHDLRAPEGTEQTVQAEKVIRHPNYNPVTYEEDVALVKVNPPFNLTNFVKAFQLPNIHFIAAGNVTTAGWGVLAEGSSDVSPVLRKVTIGIMPNVECSKMYGKDFHLDKMICAGVNTGGKDACQGDSGGPLLCDDVRFGDTLCGIVSYGHGCARPQFAGVYTRVAHYTDWVEWEMKKEDNPVFVRTTTITTTRQWSRRTGLRQPPTSPATTFSPTTSPPPKKWWKQWWKSRNSGARHSLSYLCILITALIPHFFSYQ